MGDRSWHLQCAELRGQHRADRLQVLAYANLSGSGRVVCCLIYQYTLPTWESLKQRNRLFHRATLPYRGRQIDVWLTAVPMHAQVDRISLPVIVQLRSIT